MVEENEFEAIMRIVRRIAKFLIEKFFDFLLTLILVLVAIFVFEKS